MKAIIEAVYALLQEQNQIQRELLDLSHTKRQAVINNDTDKLTEIISQEFRLLARMDKIEKRRISAVSEASESLGKAQSDITVSDLLAHADGQMKTQLAAVREEIITNAKMLQDQNSIIRNMVEAHLQYTDTMIGFIGETTDPLNNFYDMKGKSSEADIRQSAGLFDAEI